MTIKTKTATSCPRVDLEGAIPSVLLISGVVFSLAVDLSMRPGHHDRWTMTCTVGLICATVSALGIAASGLAAFVWWCARRVGSLLAAGPKYIWMCRQRHVEHDAFPVARISIRSLDRTPRHCRHCGHVVDG